MDTIKTERLTLAPFSPSDRANLLGLLTNEPIKKTFMIPDFHSPAETETMLDRMYALAQSDAHYVRGIRVGGELIGFVNDVEIKDGSIEIGYLIHPAHWGKGYASEAVGAVIADLFAKGFTEVRAGAFTENPASRRVMEKCGMTLTPFTEVIQYHGQPHDCVYYAIKNDKEG